MAQLANINFRHTKIIIEKTLKAYKKLSKIDLLGMPIFMPTKCFVISKKRIFQKKKETPRSSTSQRELGIL